MKRTRQGALFGLILALSGQVFAVESAVPAIRPAGLGPSASLIAYAQAHAIPLQEIVLADRTAGPHPGDEATMLITLVRRNQPMEQWLALLQADELTGPERASPPTEDIVYTATGRTWRFQKSPAALRVLLVGPFIEPAQDGSKNNKAPTENRVRLLIPREYFAHGFAAFARMGAAAGRRAQAAGLSLENFPYGTDVRPVPEPVLKAAWARLAPYGLTTEDEEAENEGYFALTAIFDAALKVPGFDAPAKVVLRQPSVWSVVRHLGYSASYDMGWLKTKPVEAGPGKAPTFEFPIKIFFNGQLGTIATLRVGLPLPPLEVCGGIMAIDAQYPGDPSRRAFIRLVAARPAGTK